MLFCLFEKWQKIKSFFIQLIRLSHLFKIHKKLFCFKFAELELKSSADTKITAQNWKIGGFQHQRDPRFESSHWQILFSIKWIKTVLKRRK